MYPNQDQTQNLDMCLDLELNLQPFFFFYGMMLQPTEPHCPGLRGAIFYALNSTEFCTENNGHGAHAVIDQNCKIRSSSSHVIKKYKTN